MATFLALSCTAGFTASTAFAGSAASIHSGNPLQLEIQPAAESSPGGWHLPVRFTIRNTGNQPVHACLSGARVVHLWELGRNYGYTLSQRKEDQPGCEEPFDLPPQGEHSWTEAVTIPQIPAGSARLVAFTQVVPPGPCAGSDCDPVWLTASFTPFKVEEVEKGEEAEQARLIDLRTNVTSADLRGPSPLVTPGGFGGER